MVPKYKSCNNDGGDSNEYQPWYYAYVPKRMAARTDWTHWELRSRERRDQINLSEHTPFGWTSDQFCTEHIFELQEFVQIIDAINKQRDAQVPIATSFIALLNTELSELYPGDKRAHYQHGKFINLLTRCLPNHSPGPKGRQRKDSDFVYLEKTINAVKAIFFNRGYKPTALSSELRYIGNSEEGRIMLFRTLILRQYLQDKTVSQRYRRVSHRIFTLLEDNEKALSVGRPEFRGVSQLWREEERSYLERVSRKIQDCLEGGFQNCSLGQAPPVDFVPSWLQNPIEDAEIRIQSDELMPMDEAVRIEADDELKPTLFQYMAEGSGFFADYVPPKALWLGAVED